MSVAMYIDGEYLGASAYHYGNEHGLTRAKVDYLALYKHFNPNEATVYIAPDRRQGNQIAFAKFLAKCGYSVKQLPPENRSANITAQLVTDVHANFLGRAPRQVVIVTGHGNVAPMCRVLVSRCDLKVLAFPGSASRALTEVGVDTELLTKMLYQAAPRREA